MPNLVGPALADMPGKGTMTSWSPGPPPWSLRRGLLFNIIFQALLQYPCSEFEAKERTEATKVPALKRYRSAARGQL